MMPAPTRPERPSRTNAHRALLAAVPLLAAGSNGITASIGSIGMAGLQSRLAGAARPAGISTLPAAAVLARSAPAVAAVRTLAVAGSLRSGSDTIAFDVRSTARGAEVSGTLVERSAHTVVGPIRFVVVGPVLYLEAGAPYWRQAIASGRRPPAGDVARAVASLAGRWIALGGAAAQSFASNFGGVAEPGKLAQSLVSGSGGWTKGAPQAVRGRRVLPIRSGSGGTVYVALGGAPLPVAVAGRTALGTSPILADASITYPATLAIAVPKGAVTLAAIDRALSG